jgi:hypothetical protein
METKKAKRAKKAKSPENSRAISKPLFALFVFFAFFVSALHFSQIAYLNTSGLHAEGLQIRTLPNEGDNERLLLFRPA